MQSKTRFLSFLLMLVSLNSWGVEVVRCGGKLYSLEYLVNKGNSPIGGASLFSEGQIGNGTIILATHFLSTIQRTFPFYKQVAGSYIQNILNEGNTKEEFLWKKTQLGFPAREIVKGQLDLDPSCFTNGKATVFEIIRYSKLGSINLFEYDEKLFEEIRLSDLQKNFVLVANFFHLFNPVLEDRANLTSLMMTKEILFIPNEVLASIIRSFGLSLPDASGICGKSPLMGDFLQRHFALNCDLIEESELKDVKEVKLIGDEGANSFLYPQDFSGLNGVQHIHIENTDRAPLVLGSESFQNISVLKTVRLPRNKMENVPCQILIHSPKLELLDLSYNHITEYSRDAICGIFSRGTSQTNTLDLSYNGTGRSPRKKTYFYPGVFGTEVGLTNLYLRDMNIETIGKGVLSGPSSLKVLDLGLNLFRNLDFIVDSKLSENLVSLDISQNPIKSLDPNFWDNFKNLQILKMEKMSFHVLPDLKPLKKLKELHFCNQFLKEKIEPWLAEFKKINPKTTIKKCSF